MKKVVSDLGLYAVIFDRYSWSWPGRKISLKSLRRSYVHHSPYHMLCTQTYCSNTSGTDPSQNWSRRDQPMGKWIHFSTMSHNIQAVRNIDKPVHLGGALSPCVAHVVQAYRPAYCSHTSATSHRSERPGRERPCKTAQDFKQHQCKNTCWLGYLHPKGRVLTRNFRLSFF